MDSEFVFPFEKLRVWQQARQWISLVYRSTRKFPSSEAYGLVSQWNRAAVSVASNLAEGSARTSLKDQAHFSQVAYSSLMESACLAIVASDQGFLPLEQMEEHRRENRLPRVANQRPPQLPARSSRKLNSLNPSTSQPINLSTLFAGAYAGKRVLVTGHTGFKGAWLCEWLCELGAQVTGFALAPPTTPAFSINFGWWIASTISPETFAIAISSEISCMRPTRISYFTSQLNRLCGSPTPSPSRLTKRMSWAP